MQNKNIMIDLYKEINKKHTEKRETLSKKKLKATK